MDSTRRLSPATFSAISASTVKVVSTTGRSSFGSVVAPASDAAVQPARPSRRVDVSSSNQRRARGVRATCCGSHSHVLILCWESLFKKLRLDVVSRKCGEPVKVAILSWPQNWRTDNLNTRRRDQRVSASNDGRSAGCSTTNASDCWASRSVWVSGRASVTTSARSALRL